MRFAMLFILGSIAGATQAQSASSFVQAHSTGAYSPGWVALIPNDTSPFGFQPTPTMVRMDAARRSKGLAYLNANAHTAEDIKALAVNCHKIAATPNYCAIPEMRQIARISWR